MTGPPPQINGNFGLPPPNWKTKSCGSPPLPKIWKFFKSHLHPQQNQRKKNYTVSPTFFWWGSLPPLPPSFAFFDTFVLTNLGYIRISDSNCVRFLLRHIFAIPASCRQAPGFLSRGFLPPASATSFTSSLQKGAWEDQSSSAALIDLRGDYYLWSKNIR